jgi:hypothetical protein
MRDNLLDPGLFGNEAGEDEDLEILNSYFVGKKEFGQFHSAANPSLLRSLKKGGREVDAAEEVHVSAD